MFAKEIDRRLAQDYRDGRTTRAYADVFAGALNERPNNRSMDEASIAYATRSGRVREVRARAIRRKNIDIDELAKALLVMSEQRVRDRHAAAPSSNAKPTIPLKRPSKPKKQLNQTQLAVAYLTYVKLLAESADRQAQRKPRPQES